MVSLITEAPAEVPEQLWADYDLLFRRLGVKDVRHLDITSRDQAVAAETLALFDGATGVIFAGGDHIRITGLFAGTPACLRMRPLYAEGGVIAGT